MELLQSCTKPSIWHYQNCLTHWNRDKMDAISQTTFSSIFSWMKMSEFWLKFHWNLFPRVQLTTFLYWFRLWLGAIRARSHYLNQWWLVFRRIFVSLSLSELTLVQVLACDLFGTKPFTWSNAALLSIGPLGTNINENWTKIFSINCLWKMTSAKWEPFWSGLRVSSWR